MLAIFPLLRPTPLLVRLAWMMAWMMALCFPAVAREWTDSTGSFKVEAEFVAVRGTNVILEKTNGQIITLPIERLSTSDQAFLRELQAEMQKPSAVATMPGKESTEPSRSNRPKIAPSANGLELAEQTEQILRTACYRCHGEDGTSEGGFNFVANMEKLATTFAKPGVPSLLVERITDDEDSAMPPAGEEPRLSEEQIAIVKAWIAAGSPTKPKQEARAFVRNEDIVRYISKHIAGIGERNRRYMRYFTLTHLYNSGVSEDELQTYRNAFAKLLNSLSWNTDLVIPETIDPSKTIFAIDMRNVHWNSEIWDAVEDANPYFLELSTPEARICNELAATRMPYVRADWFVFAASKPPLYHTVLGLPETDRELESLLRVNVAANIQQEQAIRAAFNRSGVSQNNRLIEWHKSPYGSYWKSYDFGGNIGRQNLFEYPMGPDMGDGSFNHDGGEIIFTLPNGLQGYLLADEAGQRINQGPTNIVSDPKQPDRTVTNGVSCMSCHYAGIIPKRDEVGVAVRANRNAFQEAEDILALYRDSSELDSLMERDAAKFADVLKQLGINNISRSGESISAIAARFQIDIDLRNAAAEFGLEPEEFLERLASSTQVARMFSSLTIKAGTIKRDVFKDVFTNACIDLKLTTPDASSSRPMASDRRADPSDDRMPARLGRSSPRGRVSKVTEVAVFDDLKWGVSSLGFSRGGKFLAAGRPDRSLVLFDVAEHSIAGELRDLDGLQKVTMCVFTPDGSRLLVAGSSGQIKVYEVSAVGMLKEVGQFAGHSGEITSLTISSDGRYALSGSQEKKARYWEISSGQEMGLIDGFKGSVKAVHISRTNASLQATDGELLIEYDSRSKNATRKRSLTSSWASGQAAAFSPKGDFVAAGDTYNIRVWNVKTGRELSPLIGNEIQWSIAFSPDGETLYSGGNAKVSIWNAIKAQRSYIQETSGTGYIQTLAVSDDGELFAAPGSSDRKLHIYRVP
jgi:WD40 repeat protein/mono/diheme cytochrome c family protein